MVRLQCDGGDDHYVHTGNVKNKNEPWRASDVVDAVINQFYIVSDCGSCGSYYLDVSLTTNCDLRAPSTWQANNILHAVKLLRDDQLLRPLHRLESVKGSFRS